MKKNWTHLINTFNIFISPSFRLQFHKIIHQHDDHHDGTWEFEEEDSESKIHLQTNFYSLYINNPFQLLISNNDTLSCVWLFCVLVMNMILNNRRYLLNNNNILSVL